MKTTFQIGTCIFTVCTDFSVTWGENAKEFIIDEKSGNSKVCYEIRAVDHLPQARGKKVLQREDVEVWQTDIGEQRHYKLGTNRTDYAVSMNEQVWYDKHYQDYLKDNRVLFSLLSLERLMLSCNSLILHSSYIVYKDKAILFTAPSGTGKSTQADLWRKYRGAEIINGDRCLIHYDRKASLWIANGWPFSGSSTFCRNKSVPIRAIVYLSQQRENQIERWNPAQAVKKLLSEMTVNFWNGDFVNHVMNELEQLVFQVPYYHLGCTADEKAVECLELVLEEGI